MVGSHGKHPRCCPEGASHVRLLVDPAFALDVLPGTSRWSDYDGDEIYGDYVVDDVTGDVTETMAYLPGVGQMDTQTGEIVYFHGDQITSLRAVSNEQSAVNGVMVCTAFGEQVYADGTVGTRYQFAGAWGYESSDRSDALAELGWQHVGYRYYDPSTGRFLQRDPIGIHGGLNVYEYVGSSPLVALDPSGLGGYITGGGFKGRIRDDHCDEGSFEREWEGKHREAQERWDRLIHPPPRPKPPYNPPPIIWPSIKTNLQATGIGCCVAGGVFAGPPGWLAGAGAILGGHDIIIDNYKGNALFGASVCLRLKYWVLY
ncbi:MAG: RHS repeat-associated core domain-containing protein [Planctomycetota bacterium]